MHTAVGEGIPQRLVHGGRDVDVVRRAAHALVNRGGGDGLAVGGDAHGLAHAVGPAVQQAGVDGHEHAARLVGLAARRVGACRVADPGDLPPRGGARVGRGGAAAAAAAAAGCRLRRGGGGGSDGRLDDDTTGGGRRRFRRGRRRGGGRFRRRHKHARARADDGSRRRSRGHIHTRGSLHRLGGLDDARGGGGTGRRRRGRRGLKELAATRRGRGEGREGGSRGGRQGGPLGGGAVDHLDDRLIHPLDDGLGLEDALLVVVLVLMLIPSRVEVAVAVSVSMGLRNGPRRRGEGCDDGVRGLHDVDSCPFVFLFLGPKTTKKWQCRQGSTVMLTESDFAFLIWSNERLF